MKQTQSEIGFEETPELAVPWKLFLADIRAMAQRRRERRRTAKAGQSNNIINTEATENAR